MGGWEVMMGGGCVGFGMVVGWVACLIDRCAGFIGFFIERLTHSCISHHVLDPTDDARCLECRQNCDLLL